MLIERAAEEIAWQIAVALSGFDETAGGVKIKLVLLLVLTLFSVLSRGFWGLSLLLPFREHSSRASIRTLGKPFGWCMVSDTDEVGAAV